MSRSPWYKRTRTRLRKWEFRWCPEVALFATDEARVAAWGRATSSILSARRLALSLIVLATLTVAWSALIELVDVSTLAWAGLQDPRKLRVVLDILGGFALAQGYVYSWRHPFRKSIREQLIEAGIAVCMKCGYDLRGQTEPRCPECGTPFDPGLISQNDGVPTNETGRSDHSPPGS